MAAVLLLPILSGCDGQDDPRAGDVEPVALDLEAPTYAFETAYDAGPSCAPGRAIARRQAHNPGQGAEGFLE